MKKTFFILTLVFAGITLSYSQAFKVTNSGQINIGNPQFSNSSYYTMQVVGSMHYFSQTQSGNSGWMLFQLGTANPRIAGAGNCVVFYNGFTSTFNDLQVRSIFNYSDKNAKKNIRPLANTSDIIAKLNPVTYDWIEGEQRKSATGKPLQEIGFIAQEVEEILPELVAEDDEGRKLVNYTGIIPILTEAVKTLNQKVKELEGEIELSKTLALRSSSGITGNVDVKISNSKLYYNAPNPFTQNTLIKYHLDESVKSAQLCIYDLQGKQIKQIILTQRGEGSELISGSELVAGMYLYSLIADGIEIDTKRMVLTK